ncbi:MAG TPA: PA14 domain-containing protein [Albitalea sp.]|jgi:YVTN family beta-propeller protein|nr:PA14 domain-containing protein [Albitalea sp.]
MKNKLGALSRRVLACSLSTALLVSCGGGGDDTSGRSTPAESTRRKAQAVFTPTTPIPADAHLKGMWGEVQNWPLIAVHAVLMPDGRVLTYGTDGAGAQTGNFIYDVWDPEGGFADGHLTLPNGTGTDIFCSSQLVLPQGGAVFVAGGDNWTGTATTNTGNNNSNLFAYEGNSLTRGNNMNRARWYSSSITLINGETYVQGGSGGTDRPEVRAADGSFRLLGGANTSAFDYMYPRNFVAPDGRVFGYDSAGRMYYVDPNGAGSATAMGQFNAAYTGNDASAAMFRPGRILQFGGNSNGAVIIDIRGPAPTVTPTMSMSSQRRLVTGTLLPDGKVLATGGSSQWNALVNVNNSAEIWNPDNGSWTVGASGVQARLYHSTALLMPDASVLVAGGGAPGPQNNRNVELYFPPYLFTGSGTLAPRPEIATAPTVLNIGQTFNVDLAGNGPVGRVVLVKTGSVTHSFNMEQRFVELTFNANGSRLAVQAPTRAGDAPPGFYMLFVLDAAGVPSVAKILRINVAATPNPAITPTLANPGDRTSTLAAPTSLQLLASDPNGDTLRYTATGLPSGLALDSASGLISGTPTTNGAYNVVATVSDGINLASMNFTWSVSGGSGGFEVTIPMPPAPVVSGSTASFTASANGSNTLYKWDFGDGTPETAYAGSPSTTHAYAQPGLYHVTVTAIDDGGIERRQTVLQAIYLAPTAQAPATSGNLLVEPGAGGNARLWVVNQDNDTVSVFDAVTRGKLAEIAVGSAPRAIARAPNGMLWVTNKQSATISVVDPGTLALNRTLALPRGSQPFGVAMSAGAGYALVVLEATGRVLKFDAGSYAQLASAAVGANPRHVSISGDGGTAYVSRFVTPPLAGESTAVVDTAAGGGEVVVIAPSAMTVLRTLVLGHGDKPDAENQGRGVPNYLGAAVLSPDGTQAWVPSKQDNVRRGTLRDGLSLNFQNTVRAISSRLDLVNQREDVAARIDHDNASVASAGVYDPKGLYLFVALETSREIAVVDAHGKRELFRFDAGRAPQGVAISADGQTLYVSNFMDRSVGVYDLRPLTVEGRLGVSGLATLASVSVEKLGPSVLTGKQLFYDARDTRLARDRYMSCAACHNDGGQDGRVWDLTGFGEGLRNTVGLRGRAGAQGFLHWSNNFDEVQDFEGQIRSLSGGTGLMADADFAAGTRSQPLGDRKAGLSVDLDALAAYVASLNSFDASPHRPSAAALSATGTEGKALFASLNCASCHSGTAFSGSGDNTLSAIGTVKPASGKRLWGPLAGIDVPTLRDVWASAPYLHDGSAATLEAAVRAHNGVSVGDADLAKLVSFLREIGGDEAPAVASASNGTGLSGAYFNNITVTGSPVLARTEAVDFNWGTAAPGTGVGVDNFSVRWSGSVRAPSTGTYRFQTESDDGIRLWVNGVPLINNWTDHSPSVDTSAGINLVAGQSYDVRLEYYERGGGAVARLSWQMPGELAFVPVPASRLFPPAVVVGSGLLGSYFNNTTMTGTAVLTRTEPVDFAWGTGSPGAAVATNNFSARWTGTLAVATTGAYRFQTVSDEGVRVYVNGVRIINNWTAHTSTTDTSANVNLTAGQRVPIVVEYFERTSSATMRLRWRLPGNTSYVAIPAGSLFTN